MIPDKTNTPDPVKLVDAFADKIHDLHRLCDPGQSDKNYAWGEIEAAKAALLAEFSRLSKPQAHGLDLEALEAYMRDAVSGKPDWPGLETAGLAWIEVIRQLRATPKGKAFNPIDHEQTK